MIGHLLGQVITHHFVLSVFYWPTPCIWRDTENGKDFYFGPEHCLEANRGKNGLILQRNAHNSTCLWKKKQMRRVRRLGRNDTQHVELTTEWTIATVKTCVWSKTSDGFAGKITQAKSWDRALWSLMGQGMIRHGTLQRRLLNRYLPLKLLVTMGFCRNGLARVVAMPFLRT